MKHYYDVALNSRGSIPNPTITVYVGGTNQVTLATIFSDDGITQKTQPFTGDSLGNFDFYVADGRYDIKISGSSVFTRLETDVEIADVTQANAGDAPWQFSTASSVAIKPGATDGLVYVSTSGSDANDGLSPGSAKATIAAAISALPASGGVVQLMAGTFAQNASLTLKSNLTIQGVGRGDTSGTPATIITTTLTSGDLFQITNLSFVSLRDFSIKNTAGTGSNAAIRLNYGQFCVVQRLFISGNFAVGIELDTSSGSAASTIRNWFDNVFITSVAASGGIGVLLNSSNATNKVINNNVFWMVAAQGGTSGGVGLKVTNSNSLQNINENLFYGDEFATATGMSGGTGIQFTSTATRGMVFLDCNVESNHVGLNKATANTVTFVGGNFSSNDTNVTDSQPLFTQFIGTNVGGTVQTYAVTPAGGGYLDGVGLGGAAPLTGAINGPGTGMALAISGTSVVTVNNNSVVAAQPFQVTEGAAPAGAGGSDFLWADSTAHRLKMNNNNVGAVTVAGIATSSPTTGNTVKFDANGNLVDAGGPPAGGFTNVNVTPVTVNANTTGDQSLMSATIPAGTLNSVGKTLMVQCAFLYSTPVASTATINLKVKLGALTLATITSSANPGTVTNNSINLLLWVTTQTAGATAAFECHGNMVIDLGASPGLADSTFSDNNTTTISPLDSTAQQTLQITGAFSAASGSNSITQRQMILDSVD